MDKPLLTNNHRRRPWNARKRTNLDVVDIVPRIVVVCDVEVVHIVVVVIVVVIVVVVVAVSIVHNICTHRCSSPTINGNNIKQDSIQTPHMTKLMKVNPLIDPDGAQSGSASYDSGCSMLPSASNPIRRTWGL